MFPGFGMVWDDASSGHALHILQAACPTLGHESLLAVAATAIRSRSQMCPALRLFNVHRSCGRCCRGTALASSSRTGVVRTWTVVWHIPPVHRLLPRPLPDTHACYGGYITVGVHPGIYWEPHDTAAENEFLSLHEPHKHMQACSLQPACTLSCGARVPECGCNRSAP